MNSIAEGLERRRDYELEVKCSPMSQFLSVQWIADRGCSLSFSTIAMSVIFLPSVKSAEEWEIVPDSEGWKDGEGRESEDERG
jgi:hypothetical protein